LITVVIFFGEKMLTKLGIVFFVVVCITIILFYLGLLMAPFNSHPDGLTGLESDNFADNLDPDYDADASFSVSLAVFFPTFAAIFSGADRSKKLRNPARDIPIGTFAAVILSAVMYASFMILWGGVAHREYLKGNFDYFDRRRLAGGGSDGGQIVKDICVVPPIIVELGIIVACISLSIQCMIVAPLLLWEVANDALIPRLQFFDKLNKGQPTRALVFTGVISALIGLSGSLDLVAPFLTM
jgi:amino acid transporter